MDGVECYIPSTNNTDSLSFILAPMQINLDIERYIIKIGYTGINQPLPRRHTMREFKANINDIVAEYNNLLEYALVETLNGNYTLKPLAKAEARGDSIEIEFYGTSMEDIKAQKNEHMAQMKADGLLIDYNNQ